MFSFKKLSHAQQNIFSAIQSARQLQKRTAIFTQRLTGKTNTIFTYIFKSFEKQTDHAAIIIVPTDTVVESYLVVCCEAFKSVLQCENVKIIEDDHICGRRADGTEFHLWCVSTRMLRTSFARVIEKNSSAIIFVDEVNAFWDQDLHYLRLRIPFFIAVGSHDIENTLIGNLMGLNYSMPINTLQF